MKLDNLTYTSYTSNMVTTSLTPALDSLNPFVVLRARARNRNGYFFTQAELARSAGVTDQYIQKQEYGIINKPSPKVNEFLLSQIYPEPMVPMIRTELADLYEHYLAGCRDETPQPLQNFFTKNLNTHHFSDDDVSELVNDWYFFWARVKRYEIGQSLVGFTPNAQNLAQLIEQVANHLGRPTSVYEFCRTFCVHIYSAQSQLGDSQVTGYLAEALSQAGITWGQ